jgi:hypothetical protein
MTLVAEPGEPHTKEMDSSALKNETERILRINLKNTECAERVTCDEVFIGEAVEAWDAFRQNKQGTVWNSNQLR